MMHGDYHDICNTQSTVGNDTTWETCHNSSHMSYGYIGGVIMMIAYLIIIVILIYYVLNNGLKGKNSKKNSLDILNERLAKGEITIEEYKKIKERIEK